MLVASLILLPINSEPLQNSSYQIPPGLEIMVLIATAIGFSFFILECYFTNLLTYIASQWQSSRIYRTKDHIIFSSRV